jgi:hypothetical protein
MSHINSDFYKLSPEKQAEFVEELRGTIVDVMNTISSLLGVVLEILQPDLEEVEEPKE